MSINTSVYAFVAWIASILAYIVFLCWIFIDNSTLESFGITYYPSKFNAISIPSYCIVVYLLISVFYMGYNMSNTHSPKSFYTIMDEYSINASNEFIKCDAIEGIPDIGDIHPSVISFSLVNEEDAMCTPN